MYRASWDLLEGTLVNRTMTSQSINDCFSIWFKLGYLTLPSLHLLKPLPFLWLNWYFYTLAVVESFKNKTPRVGTFGSGMMRSNLWRTILYLDIFEARQLKSFLCPPFGYLLRTIICLFKFRNDTWFTPIWQKKRWPHIFE